MDMVFAAIKLHQFSFKVVTDTGKDALEIAEHLFGEDLSSIFCDEDQVHVHLEKAVSAASNIVALNAGTGQYITTIWQSPGNSPATALAVGDGRVAVVSEPRILDLYGLRGY